MSYSSINRYFWHLIIGFSTILLFVSSCELIALEHFPVSQDTVKQLADGNRHDPHLNARAESEIQQSISQATGQKKYPIYAKSETQFATKTMFPTQIEFFKNDKGEVTHFIVKKNLRDHHDQRLKLNTNEELDVGMMGMGRKILP